ncbi:hypothetical protein [Alienimonas californiensis]|uniref:Uncharacterized protein n=1 Tax=Alienimonas californiensis TaxID=2527989 RepID=A0A517PCR7_9PLAN|nr:hypothetical protein [Alienimonas californiensis]QDT17174.1 hypothetical protein CA12_32860 [Alienimonas californiensis]
MNFTAPPSDRPVAAAPPESVVLIVDPRRIVRWLLAVVVVVAAVGTAADWIIYQVADHPDDGLARVARRFDLGHEPSLPAWYSSLALLACGALAALIARVVREDRLWWGLLAALFAGLALDEAVMIHEMADGVTHEALDGGGVLYFTWVVPGLIFVAGVCALFARFLWRLPARTRWRFILAGGTFVAGAVGMEMAAGAVVDSYPTEAEGIASPAHIAVQAVEESLEMLGVLLFLAAELDYLAMAAGSIVLRFARTGPADELLTE